MGTSSHTHDSVKLEILLKENLCMKMDITKFINFLIIGEMSSFASISSDMSIELGSQESFLKKWNSLLNINGTLNIQFD